MPRSAVFLKSSERIRNLLEKELNRRHLESHYILRMRIIQMSLERCNNKDIANLLECSLSTVRRWRFRWNQFYNNLEIFEKGDNEQSVSDSVLIKKIKELLSDTERLGKPPRLTDTEIKRLTTLACQSPSDFELPFSSWTHAELSKQANKMGIIISASHFGRILKKTS